MTDKLNVSMILCKEVEVKDGALLSIKGLFESIDEENLDSPVEVVMNISSIQLDPTKLVIKIAKKEEEGLVTRPFQTYEVKGTVDRMYGFKLKKEDLKGKGFYSLLVYAAEDAEKIDTEKDLKLVKRFSVK
ncbi:MAG: hypothetical protein N4A47_03430 [Clostridia bacterium]|jgi:hypothetical protein|nr:hypothetical protein [Clostridia bacterium]